MKKNLITATLLLTLSAATTAEENTKLSPVTVYSAYATPVNQDQTASSVTVLTEKDFAERNATYVSDVLKTVPGVAMGANGGRGATTSLFLRGAESDHVVVVIDGVKVNPLNSGFNFGGLPLSSIDRVEVLRGEQSALWGSNAIGGVVYITTKSGLYKDKPFNVDFDLGTGSHGTYDGSATVSGYNNGFYYSLHGDSHRTRGISVMSSNKFNYTAENGQSISTGGATERDKFHRDNASARFGYDDNNKGVEFLASHSSQTFHNDSSLYSELNNQIRTRESIFKLSGYLGNDQELFKHKFSVSHLNNDLDTFTTSNDHADSKKSNANYQLDVNFDREGSVKQSVSLLAEYQKSKYDSKAAYINVDNKKLAERSIASEYHLFTEEDHSLSVSGRYTDSSQYKDSFTGRISGAYRLSPNFRAHAGFGTGVRNPTFLEYYGYYGTSYVTAANFGLKPVKSKGGELGLLMETTNKRHSLDITYFARNVKDFIKYGNNQYTNLDGTTRVRGIELAYKGKLAENLTAYVNYTFTRTKDSKGVELIRRPKHTANAGLAYQITDKLGSDVNISYIGRRIDTYYFYPSPSVNVKMPSYTLVNLGVNYQFTKNFNVYANLNNVFDKKYENVLEYGQDGRNVYVGLKSSF